MEYYIQGDAANADKIKAAFEKLGYDVTGFDMCNDNILFFTYELEGGGKVISTTNANLYTANIIKTHPDYQKLELPAEPKFKVGDWITNDTWTHCIQSISNGFYHFLEGGRLDFGKIDGYYHLWTIQDAKDGDVITNGKMIVIFNKLEEPAYKQHIIAYVGLDLCGKLQITEDTWQLGVDKAMPATKEQRDLLFRKMREAGYEWDDDKKELRKIQPHYDIKNFYAGMPVLVRADNSCKWDYSVFSRVVDNEYWHFAVCNGVCFTQCVPLNEDTKHLLGTTDMPSEEFINW